MEEDAIDLKYAKVLTLCWQPKKHKLIKNDVLHAIKPVIKSFVNL